MINKLLQWFLNPPDTAPRATILLRLMAGGVFLWEGILKFVYPNQGVGRFTKIGIPAPQIMASFVGGLEIIGGILLLLGLLTRLIAVPFIMEMLVAMASTKISLFFGTSPLPPPPSPPLFGFWAVLHEIRSEYAQLLTVLFLLIAGSGAWSVDALLARKRKRGDRQLVNGTTSAYRGDTNMKVIYYTKVLWFLAVISAVSLLSSKEATAEPHNFQGSEAPREVKSLQNSTKDQPQYASIGIDNFTFKPDTIMIKAGSTVTWENHDDAPHAIRSVDKKEQYTSEALDTDEKFSHSFSKPGTYEYYCALHPHMRGKIIVQ